MGTGKPRAGSGGGDESHQPSPLPVFVRKAGDGGGGRKADAVGLPRQVQVCASRPWSAGPVCWPGEPCPCQSHPQLPAWISIHVPSSLMDGTGESAAPAPPVSLHFVKQPVTMTDGASPGGCCSVRFSDNFAVQAAQSRAKDKCSCVKTVTWAPKVMPRELQREKQQLCREIWRWGKRLLTKPLWHGLSSA